MNTKDNNKKKNKDIAVSDTHNCQETVSIDLMSSKRPALNIGKEWEVTVTPKRSITNIFGSKKKIDREINLSIEGLLISQDLIVDKTFMISVIVAGEEYNLVEGVQLPIKLTTENTSFSLFFNPNAIKDCKEKQRKQNDHNLFPIKFNLTTRDDSGVLISQREVTININFIHMVSEPKVTFKIKERNKKYSSDLGIEKIGDLVIGNYNELRHLPNLGLDCELIIKRNNNVLTDNVIWLEYAEAKGVSVDYDRRHPEKFSVKELTKKAQQANTSEISIPIYADIARIGNPCNRSVEKFEYTFDVILKYWNENEPNNVNQLPVPQVKFILEGNRQEPNISKIEVRDPQTGIAHLLNNDGRVQLTRTYFLPGQNLKLVIPMTIHNSANQGVKGSGIVVRNFDYEVDFGLGTVVQYASMRRDNQKTLITLEGPKDTTLPNKAHSRGEWNFVFSGDAVRDLYVKGAERNYNVDIKITVMFDYCLDAEGKADILPSYFEDNKKQFKAYIHLPVYQQPNQRWLAVDFGTSAIVSKFGEQMIDLHHEKIGLYNDSEDAYEQGTPFLSSNILLRPVSTQALGSRSQLMMDFSELPEDGGYDKLAVCLSPTSTYEKANISTILPCLKLIVGYDLLPNVENYENYRYQYLGPDGELQEEQKLMMKETYEDGDVEDVETPLAKVDTIFSEVYSELFTYFLAPAIKAEARKINQLILTIPNTYTPAHMHRIRNIVKGALKGLNIRTINFVSESDAVACYYQRHWTDINMKLNRHTNEKLKNEEVVLVYDMGAGTLDVTLFVKTMVKDAKGDDKIVINVLGKIGIAKAGNYLDALLAQLLAKKITQLAPFADPEQINTGDRVKAALQLKTIIKNDIKPLLSTPGASYTFARDMSLGVRNDVILNLDRDIKEAPEFKKYVNEVTTEFLENFYGFFSSYKDQKIDTVLMSGRSIKLKPIQEALKDALAKWSAPDVQLIDISSLTDSHSGFDRSKTVVVEGAIDYASLFGSSDSSVEFNGPNIVACYGILYRDTHGAVQYAELLNPRILKPTESVVNEGMKINIYCTPEKLFDLSATETLQLVQTFSSDTCKDWISGNHEYITPISKVNITSLPSRKAVRIQLKVDKHNTMQLFVNGMERAGITTSKIDINSRSNQFSLWPVLNSGR